MYDLSELLMTATHPINRLVPKVGNDLLVVVLTPMEMIR